MDSIEMEKIYKKFEEKILQQSQLIDSLKARIEELEADSIIKDQDIQKLQTEINNCIQLILIASEKDKKINTSTTTTTETTKKTGITVIPNFIEIRTSKNRGARKTSSSQRIFMHEYMDNSLLKCKLCEEIFISNKEFNRHAKAEHELKHLCFNCSEVFEDKTSLGKHIGRNHTRYCDYCDKIFKMESTLEKHVREAHLIYQDEVLNDVIEQQAVNYKKITTDIDSDSTFLHDVIQDKSGSMIFKCKKCEKIFNCLIKFRFHAMEVHHYEWVCLVCCQIFSSQGACGKHMRKNHTADFACTLCSKKCYDKTGLRHHFRAKHSEEKFPYHLPMISQPAEPLFIHEIISNKLKCKNCEKIFDNHGKFNEHAKELHGYKFLCNFCSQVFTNKKSKRKHARRAHFVACQVCQRKFRNEVGLISHCKAKNHYTSEGQIPAYFGGEGSNYLGKDLIPSYGDEEYGRNYNIKENEVVESEEYSDDDVSEEDNDINTRVIGSEEEDSYANTESEEGEEDSYVNTESEEIEEEDAESEEDDDDDDDDEDEDDNVNTDSGDEEDSDVNSETDESEEKIIMIPRKSSEISTV